ncbi:MAG TPA: septal ring lytic transglycosylase RlpA family protein [Stellaceae bacterium]|nr:septal ring lytic transglycosylase RlpA family protein [Stellaceae bacterium]
MAGRLGLSAGWVFGAAITLAAAPSFAQVSDPSGHGAVTVDAGSYNQAPRIEVGTASWYGGPSVRGKNTASGERFNEKALTAAHPTLPFETRVRVVNLNTGQSVVVRINDRNATYTQRVIDLSRKAGELIGLHNAGIGVVAIVPEFPPQPAPTTLATQPTMPTVRPLLERTATDPLQPDLLERRRPS